MRNIKPVIKFETLRSLRKISFWVTIFLFPAMMGFFFVISYFGSAMAVEQTDRSQQELIDQRIALAVIDRSGAIKPESFPEKINLEMLDSKTTDQQAIDKFQTSDDTGLIIYPENTPTEPILVYSKLDPNDLFKSKNINQSLSSIATTALRTSANLTLTSQIQAIIQAQNPPVSGLILDKNNQLYEPSKSMIVPGLAVIMLFFSFMLIGNRILMATTEEKENRVAEMILTNVSTTTLIAGKIIALVLLAAIQLVVLLGSAALIIFIAFKLNSFPPEAAMALDVVKSAELTPWLIIFSSLVFITGFMVFTGLTLLVGSLFPTAQEASGAFTPIILLIMMPVYFVGAIFTGASSTLVSFMSFFPLTAPLVLLMRQMAGSLSMAEGLIGLAVLVASMIISIWLAVKAFRAGSFDYGKRTSFKSLFDRPKA